MKTELYRRLLDNESMSVFVADREGQIIQGNQAFFNMTGYTPAHLPLPVDTMTPPEYQALDEAKRNEVQATGSGRPWKKEYMRRDGSRMTVLVGISWVDNERGHCICYAMDLSSALQSEAGQHFAKACCNDAFDDFQLIYLAVDGNGIIYAINSYGADYLGLAQEALLGTNLESLIEVADHALQREIVATALADIDRLGHGCLRVLGKDGGIFWLKVSVRALEGKAGQNLAFIVGEDVTERKRADERLQRYHRKVRALTAETVLAEEHQRRVIAIGLHDRVGHRLAIAKLKASTMLTEDLPKTTRTLVTDIMDQMDEAIAATRDLITDLSSPALYDLGLIAALQGLGGRMSSHSDLVFHMECDDLDREPSEDVRIIVYRVVRELLFNVVKHAKADAVWLGVRKCNGCLEITLLDDGVGVDFTESENFPVPPGGFGLFSIREQINLFGGRFEIKRDGDSGTRAVVTVPLEERTQVTPIVVAGRE